jgi:subtilisin family serine protease
MAVLGLVGPAPAFGQAGPSPQGDRAWWLSDLHVTQAWRTSEGAGIVVAVLGTGVAASQPDLAGAVISGPDYSGSGPFGRVPGSPYWGVEGTAVAGVIAGRGHDGNWGTGIVGVAPGATILSVRVTLEFNDPLVSDASLSQGLPDAIADGIRYAVDHGAQVIDLPLDPGTLGLTSAGDPAAAGGSAIERAAVGYALRRNVVLVAPAGDDGQGSQIVNYPAAYPGVIAVGATDRTGQLAPFSSRQPYTWLTAPGVGLAAAAPPEGYDQFSSTSTASGIVAGVAALILSRFPHLTVAQVTRALAESTVAMGSGTGMPPLPARSDAGSGYGTVDAVRAMDMAALIAAANQPRPAAARQAPPPHPPPRAAAPAPPPAPTQAGAVGRGAGVEIGREEGRGRV